MTASVMEVKEIQQYQKNRFPYLLVDRMTEIVPGQSAKGYKNLTMNEWFFPTHYEGDPIMPGLVMAEALMQVFIMTFLTMPEYKGQLVVSLKADNIVIKGYVVPGDRLETEAELISLKRGIASGRARGYVDGRFVCGAEFTVGMPAVIEKFQPKR